MDYYKHLTFLSKKYIWLILAIINIAIWIFAFQINFSSGLSLSTFNDNAIDFSQVNGDEIETALDGLKVGQVGRFVYSIDHDKSTLFLLNDRKQKLLALGKIENLDKPVIIFGPYSSDYASLASYKEYMISNSSPFLRLVKRVDIEQNIQIKNKLSDLKDALITAKIKKIAVSPPYLVFEIVSYSKKNVSNKKVYTEINNIHIFVLAFSTLCFLIFIASNIKKRDRFDHIGATLLEMTLLIALVAIISFISIRTMSNTIACNLYKVAHGMDGGTTFPSAAHRFCCPPCTPSTLICGICNLANGDCYC
jgi:hypothetical protein